MLLRAFPELSEVKLLQLIRTASPALPGSAPPPEGPSASAGGAQRGVESGAAKTTGGPLARVRDGAAKLADVLDPYGAAYVIAARWTGVVSVMGIYSLLHFKVVDVSRILETAGASQVGTVLGTWAGAVVLTSFLYPFTTYVGGAVVTPRVAELRRRWVGGKPSSSSQPPAPPRP